MKTRISIALLMLSIPAFGIAAEPLSFNRDVRPLLSNHCVACHGPDEAERKAGLRLDTHEGALALLEDGQAAIVPRDLKASLLIHRIHSTDPEEVMPPPNTRKPLTDADKAVLTRWIEEGAVWEDHWAFLAPKANAKDSIDGLVSGSLAKRGLTLSSKADKRTLARRLSFDLLGLPPKPEEVEAFVSAEDTEAAYVELVNRWLASAHFGERMAIYWLDLVRYADTCGFHGDQHRDLALYRDYVIEAFNANKPFDQFTVEQLAGDLLDNPSTEQRIASGYNRLLQTTEEGGAQPKEYRAKYAADRVRNVSTVWLGTTMGCAECHDHKFDPISQKDFYSMAAFFADIEEPAVGRNRANLRLPTPDQEKALADIDARLAPLKKDLEAAKKAKNEAEKKRLEKAVAALNGERQRVDDAIAKTLVVQVRKEPNLVRVLPRGNWLDESGDVVQPEIPRHLGQLGITDRRATRLDLANWLTNAENPLTGRVLVNRLWKLFFGHAIARTVEDVGAQGEWPTHPELLDWLAIEFVESGWDIKHMVRTIVMSDTYQQSSRPSPELREQDPYNKWLARQSRYRLDAEMVRDNALAISGLLVPKVGGTSVKPYQPEGYWGELNFPKRTYQHDRDSDQYRRGIYTYWCRTFLHPSMVAFDAPTREECTAERTRSNTPLQALAMLNDPSYVEAARVFAERIHDEAGENVELGLQWAFQRALSRSPKADEITVLTKLFGEQLRRYQDDASAVAQVFSVGETPAEKVTGVHAAWAAVARTILNLHETITRY